jgi:uncharacterized membrane protein YphA (DoxX/SURF4 family)
MVAKVLALVLRALLGGMFLYAGFAKLMRPASFADEIHRLAVLPDAMVDAAAITLPWFEIWLGAGLISGWRLAAFALGSVTLCLVFLAVLWHSRLRHLPLECMCFGTAPPRIFQAVPPLWRDGAMLGGSLLLRKLSRHEKSSLLRPACEPSP